MIRSRANISSRFLPVFGILRVENRYFVRLAVARPVQMLVQELTYDATHYPHVNVECTPEP
jgi:hypothetical protein